MPRLQTTHAAALDGTPPASADTDRVALLIAKLAPPALVHPTVARPRLLALLSRAVRRFPLTVISGPAGSGKTVLASSWPQAAGGGRPVAWVTLDDYDDDPASFWSYVVEALSGAGVPLHHLRGLVPGEPPPSGFLPRLAAAIGGMGEPVVLILDNADHATGRAVTAGLDLLIRNAGSRLRLVLCSRADPPLPLHQYRLAGTIAEIRGQQLGFTAEETRELLAGMGVSVTPDVAARLCAETLGWAVGLRLAAVPLKHGVTPEQLATSLAHDDGSVYQYLFAEVLTRQPANVRRFLLRISVTAELWPELVDRLSGRPHGRRVLAALARANAFVEESTGAPGGYRIHPLFREMLLAQLCYEHPDEVAGLRRICATWFAAHGMVPEAVAHAVAAGHWAFVARLLIDQLAVAPMLAHGFDPVLRSVAQLPRELGGAEAAVLRVTLAVMAGNRPRAADLAAAGEVGSDDRPALRASAALACLAATTASPADSEEIRSRAAVAETQLSSLPGGGGRPERRDYVALIAVAEGLAAACGEGPVEEVAPPLRAAVGAAQAAGAARLRGRAVALLAVVESLEGDLNLAGQHAAEAEALCADTGTDGAGGCVAAAAAAASVHLQRYAVTEARDWVGRALTRQRNAPSGPEAPALAAVLAVLKSRSLRLRREYDLAESSLQPQLADRIGPRWTRRLVHAEAVHSAFSRGRVEQGLHIMDAEELDPANRVRLEVLGRLLRGDGGGTALVDEPGAGLSVAVESHILRACQLAEEGAVSLAADELAHTLDLARPQLLRLPFIDAPPQARRLLRTHPRVTGAAGWLSPAAPVTAAPSPRLAITVEDEPALTQELSDRETEVLEHLAEMLSTAEIGAAMFISVNTVRTHIRSILRKLGVNRRSHAVRQARERGLL